MDSLKRIGYLCGRDPNTGEPLEIPLGLVPEPELEKLSKMSAEAQKTYLRTLLSKIPEAIRIWAGYCQDLKKHVKHRECRLCAMETKKYKQLAQWDKCKKTNISS